MRIRNILLAAGTLAILAMPATVLAKARHDVQPFSASGYLCLAQLPVDIQFAPTPVGVKIEASGEVLFGQIQQSTGWDDIEGASVAVTIAKEESSFNFASKTFVGQIDGSIDIALASGPITGSVKGVISGAFADPNDIVGTIYTSTPRVVWEAEGADVKTTGIGSATFVVDPANPFAYCGTLNLVGVAKSK